MIDFPQVQVFYIHVYAKKKGIGATVYGWFPPEYIDAHPEYEPLQYEVVIFPAYRN